jgi:hypothetical protein
MGPQATDAGHNNALMAMGSTPVGHCLAAEQLTYATFACPTKLQRTYQKSLQSESTNRPTYPRGSHKL